MIIERKPKSTLVEEIMNFKKEDKQEVTEEIKTEETQPVVEEVVKEEVSEVKPSEELLKVEIKEDKCENCIECADRKEVAEQVTKLKEQHIKHKVTKKDDKFIIECFDKVEAEKKESLNEEWQYCNCKDLDEVAKLSDYCAKNDCKITAKTSTNDGYKCRIEGPFDNVHKVNDKWSMFKWRGISLEESKELKETWAGEDVIDDIVDRAKSNIADGADVDDAVFQAIDEGLIYNKDIYALLEHYGSIDTSTIIDSYYDDLYSDVVSNLDVDESLKEEFTEKGKKMIKDAKEAGLWSFYEPYAGNFAFTSQDYKANEDKIKAFLDSHEDYALIKDNAKSYPGNDYLESSEDGIIYFVTSFGLDADEIGDAEIIIAPKSKVEECKQEESMKDVLDSHIEEEVVTEAPKVSKEESLKSKIESKLLSYIKKLGYDEKDFDDYFVVRVNKFTNDDGDTATHVQIRNDLVDFYDCEENGLISDLDKIVDPGYFEPYDAYIWDAYIWDFEKKEKKNLVKDLEDAIEYRKAHESLDEDIEIEVEEPIVDEVDDEVVYFSTDEVKDVVEDVVDEIGDEMKDKEPEEVDVEEIIDEKISDAVEEKKEEESEDDISGLEDEEETVADFSEDDMSEEDAKFFENLTISNNYKNEFKSEEQKKLDEELDEVVIKDDLGIEEDISEEDMNTLLGD